MIGMHRKCVVGALAFAVLFMLGSTLPARAQDGTWSSLDASGPSPRESSGAVYDATNHRYIVFGGLYKNYSGAYVLFNEVWMLSLDGTPNWTHQTISGPMPGERHSPQWGYDAARNRVLVFGGYGSHYPGDPYQYLNDVWQLSLDGTPQWTELTPQGTPPSGRLAGAAVYDPLRQRFVGFGGTVGLPVDTWSLELAGEAAAWTGVNTDSTSPPGGYGMTAVYDERRDRMIIFGGSTSDNYYGVRNDVWALNLQDRPTWEKLSPAGTLPVARRSGTAVYDPLRDRMVIFGGWDSTEHGTASFLNDLWALTFDPDAWAQLQPDGTLPAGRDAMTTAYDPGADRLVVFGGWSGLNDLGDTEFLSWSGTGSSAALIGVAGADPTAAHVTWTVANATGPYVGIYRRTSTTKWSSIGTGEIDGTGQVHFQDGNVIDGTHYGYMAVVASQKGETFGGEAWVAVPSPTGVEPRPVTSLSLARVAPNPVINDLVASFTLPSGDRASLELTDASGRRVANMEVGMLGPGTHHVTLVNGHDLPIGMYFLRLTQHGRSSTDRVVIVH